MAVPKGWLHLKDKNLQLMLEITTVASGNMQSHAVVGFYSVGCFFLLLFVCFFHTLFQILTNVESDINISQVGTADNSSMCQPTEQQLGWVFTQISDRF